MGQQPEPNFQNNIAHYNPLYGGVKSDWIDWIVANMRDFLPLFIQITSNQLGYFAFYHDHFERRTKNTNIFEIGAGRGLNAYMMATFGANVTTNDIADESGNLIKTIASQLNLDNITPVNGEFLGLKLPEREFDFVVGKSVLHHLTPEVEAQYLCKIAKLVKPDGEARFVEPAYNRPLLRKLRLMLPAQDRPSTLHKKAYKQWQQVHVHPERDDSSAHYRKTLRRYFREVQIVPFGGIERFKQLIPRRRVNQYSLRQSHRIESKLPNWVRLKLAKVQLIILRQPY